MYFDTEGRRGGNPLYDLANSLSERVAGIRNRRKLSQLRDLDAHLLQDVGLERGDVERALRMPLSVDAATELHRVAHQRSRLRG